MEIKPQVSIIIPCYNNQAFIGQAIDSALSQTHAECEVIVVDDGSTDQSWQIISNYGDQIVAIWQANSGACVARNAGLARSAGKWIKFLDGDDALAPDCIEGQLQRRKDLNTVIVGDYELIGSFRPGYTDRHYLSLAGSAIGKPFELDVFYESSVFTSTTLYPRIALEKFGAFDPSVKRGQEHELNVRLFLNGVDFVYYPDLCYYYRQHDSVDRISNSRRMDSYIFQFGRFSDLVDLAELGPRGEDFGENRNILAASAWRRGRRLLRSKRLVDANKFFDIAIQLAGRDAIRGGRVYRFFARSFGPLFAERASAAFNIVRHKVVESENATAIGRCGDSGHSA